jgi:ABC-type transport system involved in cytochrome bd biosynthesis fused ATPase/permease subunit
MITLQHTVQEVEMIIAALRKAFSMDAAENLVTKVRAQAVPQLQALQPQQAAAQPAETAAPEVTPSIEEAPAA